MDIKIAQQITITELVLENQKLKLDAQREAEHHDRMVGELEKVYKERDEARVTIEDAKRALNATAYEGLLLAAMRVKEERDEAREEIEALRELLASEKITRNHIIKRSVEVERERDEAREALEHITEYGTEEINAAVELRQKLASALVERDEAREIARAALESKNYDPVT